MYQKPNLPKVVNISDYQPKTPKQQKYVEQVTAKLPDTEGELGKMIADLESKKAVEKDGHKLLKINLQQFAAKEKLRAIQAQPNPINQAVGDINTARQKDKL